jgi:hypothetical protein
VLSFRIEVWGLYIFTAWHIVYMGIFCILSVFFFASFSRASCCLLFFPGGFLTLAYLMLRVGLMAFFFYFLLRWIPYLFSLLETTLLTQKDCGTYYIRYVERFLL